MVKPKASDPNTWTGFWLVVDSDNEERVFGVMKDVHSGDAIQFEKSWTEIFGDLQLVPKPILESEYGTYVALGMFPELEVKKYGLVILFGQPMASGKNPARLKVIMPPDKSFAGDLPGRYPNPEST